MSYLLDTNACIALVNGAPKVRSRFRRVTTAGEAVAVSAIVAFELWYGAARSARQAENAKRLAAFFAGPFELLAFDAEDARAAGEIRAELQAAGTPIGAYDLLIAGQALRRKLTLVTANAAEFARVRGLKWKDWAAAR